MSLPPMEQRKYDALFPEPVEEVKESSVLLSQGFIAIYALLGGTILSAVGAGMAFGLAWSFVVLGGILLAIGFALGSKGN